MAPPWFGSRAETPPYDRAGHEGTNGTRGRNRIRPALRDKAGHAFGICPAVSRSRAAQPGHRGTNVPLCPALSRCLRGRAPTTAVAPVRPTRMTNRLSACWSRRKRGGRDVSQRLAAPAWAGSAERRPHPEKATHLTADNQMTRKPNLALNAEIESSGGAAISARCARAFLSLCPNRDRVGLRQPRCLPDDGPELAAVSAQSSRQT